VIFRTAQKNYRFLVNHNLAKLEQPETYLFKAWMRFQSLDEL
jgi:hypothetical protein